MKKIILLTFVFSLVLLISCEDNSLIPVAPEPGSRNYTWTHDTSNQQSSFGHLFNFWGASANDVWACGQSGMFHYDGKEWKKYNGIGGNLDCLYGSAANNIWTFASGNYNGANVWHYNGVSWKDLGLRSFTKTDGFLGMSDIVGTAANNIYAVGIFMFGKGGGGRKGVIMHYDGTQWEFLNTGDLKTNMNNICYDKEKKKYYIDGYEEKWDTTGSIPVNTENIKKIYEFDGKNIREIFSGNDVERYSVELNGKVYFIGNNKLWSFSNNQFLLTADFSSSEYTFSNIKGRSEKDIFVWSSKKSASYRPVYITHFNGTDMVPIYENYYIYGYQIIGDDIFISANDKNYRSIISHGRLKK